VDRHFARIWQHDMSPPWRRQQRRRKGLPNYRLVRYADLCRARHKSAYAEHRIMPIGLPDALVRGGLAVSWSA
jgi:hypothetical protein